jgi:hypothetical protein
MTKSRNDKGTKHDHSAERGEYREHPAQPQRLRFSVVRRGNNTSDMGDWVIDEAE